MIDISSNILVANNNNDLVNLNEKLDNRTISRDNDEKNNLKLNGNDRSNNSTANDVAGNYYRAINDTTKFSSLGQQKNEDEKTKKEPLNDKELTKEEQAEVKELKARDNEVKTHEQAHVNAGATNAQYEYETGPDGIKYATGGHASIDTSKPDDPRAALAKAQKIKRAALAPANPSGQDLKVAAEAGTMASDAQRDITKELQENNNPENSDTNENVVNENDKSLVDKRDKENIPASLIQENEEKEKEENSKQQNVFRGYTTSLLPSSYIGHNLNLNG